MVASAGFETELSILFQQRFGKGAGHLMATCKCGNLFGTRRASEANMEILFRVIVPLLTAAIGLLGGFLIARRGINAKREDERWNAKSTRLEKQLGDLYGPLNAHLEKGTQNWHAFLNTHSRDKRPLEFRQFFPNPPVYLNVPSPDEQAEYRRQTQSMFLPTNTAMRDLILTHADLLLNALIPKSFAKFCAHVDASKDVVDRWKTAEDAGRPIQIAEHMPNIGNPLEFSFRVRISHEKLRSQRQDIRETGRRELDERALVAEIDAAVENALRVWAARRKYLEDYEVEQGLPRPLKDYPYYTDIRQEDYDAARAEMRPELDRLWGKLRKDRHEL